MTWNEAFEKASSHANKVIPWVGDHGSLMDHTEVFQTYLQKTFVVVPREDARLMYGFCTNCGEPGKCPNCGGMN